MQNIEEHGSKCDSRDGCEPKYPNTMQTQRRQGMRFLIRVQHGRVVHVHSPNRWFVQTLSVCTCTLSAKLCLENFIQRDLCAFCRIFMCRYRIYQRYTATSTKVGESNAYFVARVDICTSICVWVKTFLYTTISLIYIHAIDRYIIYIHIQHSMSSRNQGPKHTPPMGLQWVGDLAHLVWQETSEQIRATLSNASSSCSTFSWKDWQVYGDDCRDQCINWIYQWLYPCEPICCPHPAHWWPNRRPRPRP